MPLASAGLFAVAALCCAIAVVVSRRRGDPGAPALVVLLLAVAVWNGGYGLEIAVDGTGAKVAWAKAQYLGIAIVPVAFLAFAFGFTGRGASLTRRRLALLSVVPAAVLLLAATNEWHGQIWSRVAPPPAGSAADLVLEHGLAFHAGWVYAYGLLLVAAAVLLASRIRLRRTYYRRQTAAMAVAMAAPVAGNVLYVLGRSPGGVDTTTVGFAVTALCFAVACLRWGLLDTVPVARDVVVEQMREGMVVIDARGRVADCNRAARPLLRVPVEAAVGRPAAEVLRADALPPRLGHSHVVRVAGATQSAWYETHVVELAGAPGASARLLLFHDVTAREELQAHLQADALTDELTGIGNRRLFLDRTEHALQLAARDDRDLAVMLLDLDDFKPLNDTFGHQFGDEVLAEVAGRLGGCVRPGDTVARVGGDEFAVLLPELDDPATAVAVAHRIEKRISEPVSRAGRTVLLRASVGVHVSTAAPGVTPVELLHEADHAMYVAKRDPAMRVAVAAPTG